MFDQIQEEVNEEAKVSGNQNQDENGDEFICSKSDQGIKLLDAYIKQLESQLHIDLNQYGRHGDASPDKKQLSHSQHLSKNISMQFNIDYNENMSNSKWDSISQNTSEDSSGEQQVEFNKKDLAKISEGLDVLDEGVEEEQENWQYEKYNFLEVINDDDNQINSSSIIKRGDVKNNLPRD